ncbi:MAG: hypothetical protein ACK4FB_09065 [Brevundimonas sp.]|uniref:hypothetical protein n=1 Tax=Brevundimonas sp. TaxID=1871086 RepID=UPI00391A6ADB
MTDPAKAAAAIDHSRWGNRKVYGWAVTLGLAVLLGAAGHLGVPAEPIAWLLAVVIVMTFTMPSAEQMVKMMAQAAAIRHGPAARGADDDQN